MVSLRWSVAIVAIVAPSLQSSCSSIESDVDYTGPDLRSVAASAPEDCCGICADDDECKAFSHYRGICYLKSAKGSSISKSGVRSATLAPPSSQCSAIENDIDYSGADLRSVGAAVAEDCCAICADDEKCKAFSHYLGVCYLKSSQGENISKPGVCSATVAPSTSHCSAMENDVDYFGGDLATVPSTDAEDCCAICATTSGCKLFSHADGKCYLKNEVGNRVSKAGVRSALLSITSTPAPTTTQTSPVPPATTTPQPTHVCTEQQRQRRSWNSLSPEEKELQLSAVEEAMRGGQNEEFVYAHLDRTGNRHGYDSCGYFFWHRKFLLAYENMLRSLDSKYACLTLPYWDFTEDYLQFEQGKCKTISECCPVTNDWGGATQGKYEASDLIKVNTRPANHTIREGVLRGLWNQTALTNWSISNVRSALFGSKSIAKVSRQIELDIDTKVRSTLFGSLAVNRHAIFDPLYFVYFATIDLLHSIFYHCNVESLNLDDHGQQTYPSSFESCSITYDNGTTTKIEPTSEVFFQSTYDLGQNPYPIEQNKLIGRFFAELPREYFKWTDIRSLNYSYDLSSPIGNLYSTCGTN
ncbi:hypothetical protein AC1031_017342 [Aphanomyces cochlioides]|nr:hypothetical protein AC1031_017342 [Aphanomyces cochlioides]